MGLSGQYSTGIIADITNIYTRVPLVYDVIAMGTDDDAYIHMGARGIQTIINTLEFGINPIILQNLQTKSSFEEQHEEVVCASMFGIFTFICSNRLEYACRYWRYER